MVYAGVWEYLGSPEHTIHNVEHAMLVIYYIYPHHHV